MREIKFRAWDGNKMYADVGVLPLSGEEKMVASHYTVKYRPDQVDLMQYTGLKDKNGVEIYEGDIVEYSSLSLPPVHPLKRVTGTGIEAILQHSHSVIRWSAEEVGFVFGQTNSPLGFMIDDGVFDGEVIGNIYQDPRLLGEEDGE